MLHNGVTMRRAELADAEALLDAYQRNRQHLRPWEPRRDDGFFTIEGQRAHLRRQLRQHEFGRLVPWVLDDNGCVVGAIALTGILRGPFSSAYLDYWTAASHEGRGLATAAVREVCQIAATTLGLHRIEAATLPENPRSQRVLARSGFTCIGTAAQYLHVNGEWRDHLLHQRILNRDPPVS